MPRKQLMLVNNSHSDNPPDRSGTQLFAGIEVKPHPIIGRLANGVQKIGGSLPFDVARDAVAALREAFVGPSLVT